MEVADEFLERKIQNEILYDLIQEDITKLNTKKMKNWFDVIITNPPFGTKNNEGIDYCFLEKAFQICNGNVYSFHKSSTRKAKCF